MSSLDPGLALLWLRRDFRTNDQTALTQATRTHTRVLPIFVVDPAIIGEFEPGAKPAAAFFGALLELRRVIRGAQPSCDILLMSGQAEKRIPELARELGASALFFNKDYEPRGRARDHDLRAKLEKAGIKVKAFADHVLHEEHEILNGTDKPYRIFTPYKVAAFRALTENRPALRSNPRLASLVSMSSPQYAERSQKLWVEIQARVNAGKREARSVLPEVGEANAQKRLREFLAHSLADYPRTRNLPALSTGTSHISMDLRSGALSPRQVWTATLDTPSGPTRDMFLSELLWRDFFIMIGFHFPHVFESNFNRLYDGLKWRNDRGEFDRWCRGETGYPIIDAGMRELVQTGFMHNRVRMLTAMFLTKDLLVDWRWGERFFRQHLIDGDRAVNNGNWQWCASTGVDAQPYFRIFNPTTQAAKFDPDGEYVRRWLGDRGEIPPLVDHVKARQRCLATFAAARGK